MQKASSGHQVSPNPPRRNAIGMLLLRPPSSLGSIRSSLFTSLILHHDLVCGDTCYCTTTRRPYSIVYRCRVFSSPYFRQLCKCSDSTTRIVTDVADSRRRAHK
eukprot:scpid9058/ scgid20887/ 